MKSGATSRPPTRAAFTLIELLVAILVIFLLIGLLIVGMRHAIAFAKGTGDGAAVHALRQGASQFEQQFNFSVPLVKDGIPGIFPPPPDAPGGPINNAKTAPLVYSLAPTPATNPDITILNTSVRVGVIDVNPPQPPAPAQNTATSGLTDPRFSVYSLSYYLYGTLGKAEAAASAPPIDGVDGAGFCSVKRDGSFEKQGRKFTPFYDPRRSDAVFEQSPAGQGRIELRDSHHVAFRYYRWVGDKGMPNGPLNPTIPQLKIPEMVGDPQSNADIRSASWAIVGAGPNGVFGDEDLLPASHPQYRKFDDLASAVGLSGNAADSAFVDKVRKAAAADNIVEVGQ